MLAIVSLPYIEYIQTCRFEFIDHSASRTYLDHHNTLEHKAGAQREICM